MKKYIYPLMVFLLLLCGVDASRADGKNFYAQGPSDKKWIALSFDDGPGPYTEQFLSLLKKYDVKATFFMLGELVQSQAGLVRRVKDDGHEVASHTFTHQNYKARLKQFITANAETKEHHPKSEAAVRQELLRAMKKAKSVTESAIDGPVRLCRMPHGIDAPWVRETAREAGFVLVNWTYGADWTNASEASLIESYGEAIKPGAILLLHDGGKKREKSLAITEAVIKAAQAKGFKIVPVGQLLGIPANPPQK